MNKLLKATSFFFFLFSFTISNAQDTLSRKESFLNKHEAGFYLGAYKAKAESFLFTPQAWMYFNNLYVEARYNYEAAKTFSIHFGKSILLKNDDLELIPTAGIVFGEFNGASAGLNINYETAKLSGFTQTQYTLSFNNNKNEPFYFSWLGITTPVYKNFNAGASWQWLAQKKLNPEFDLGPMFSYTKNNWGLELYAYNFWNENRYWQAAVYIDLAD